MQKTRARCIVSVAAFIAVAALGAPRASAQRNATAGLLMSAHAVALHNDSAGRRIEKGAGLGALLGFGVTDQVAAFVRVGAGGLGTGDGAAMIAWADLGLRGTPVHIGRVAPYGEVSYTARGRDAAEDRQVISTGASLGVGADIGLRRGLSLDVALIRMRASYREDFHDTPLPVPFSETTRRLQLGLTWRAVERLSR